ncbi:MAG: Trk system potassium transporter TrkA [Thermoguttaceae bacterium]|nr:Trk system potassium transporter TrkA [Thermoguttaceae bacterium]
MQVLILGAGTVGASIASELCESHSVTLVDNDRALIKQIEGDNMDIRTVVGSASEANVLFQAGVTTADICLALTGNDEVNIVGASMAKAMGVPRVAARVYAGIFSDLGTFDYQQHFNIDRFFSMEHLTAMEIARRIREPGAMLIEHFGGGHLEMQEVAITKPTSATSVPLAELKLPSRVRIGTITRTDGTTSIATADDKIEVGDRITILGGRDEVENVKRLFQTQSTNRESVLIAGGGEIGYQLARVLQERNYSITILEADRERCEVLSKLLRKSTIIHGDASQKKFLESEYVGAKDLFVACLGDDENNIMACVEAHELDVQTLVAVIERPDYAKIVGKFGISEAVSPQEVTSRQISGLMHNGPVIFRNSHLLGGDVDVFELVVGENALVTQNPLKNVGLSKKILVAAVVRGKDVLIPDAEFIIKENDTVLVLVDAKAQPELIKQFQANSPAETR